MCERERERDLVTVTEREAGLGVVTGLGVVMSELLFDVGVDLNERESMCV